MSDDRAVLSRAGAISPAPGSAGRSYCQGGSGGSAEAGRTAAPTDKRLEKERPGSSPPRLPRDDTACQTPVRAEAPKLESAGRGGPEGVSHDVAGRDHRGVSSTTDPEALIVKTVPMMVPTTM